MFCLGTGQYSWIYLERLVREDQAWAQFFAFLMISQNFAW